MILKNIHSLQHNKNIDLLVQRDQISDINLDIRGHNEIYFEDALAFPGLVNSHDHLDFNLFPRLGNSKYKNYTEWGPAINSTYASEIKAIVQIPQNLRYHWGILKNLLGGITTVVHHGYKKKRTIYPIKIIDQFQHLHSVQFEKYWKLRLNNPFKKAKASVIHLGEGIDEEAHKEINELIRYNFLNKKLIAVHGVSMNEEQAESFTALVWCPQSNEWMFGKTAEIEKLKHIVPILFGTDSTLTSQWNVWEHIRDAKMTNKLSDIELFQALTANASDVWNLNTGSLAIGKCADIVITEKKSNDTWEDFYQTDPGTILMVISNGQIVLIDDNIIGNVPLNLINRASFKPITLGERVKYIPEQFISTIREIQKFPNITLPCKIESNAFAY